jgi:hypothetical protein
MQRHSEHRLRFGIERSVDKPAAVAEFSASLGTNWVAHAALAADNGEALHVIVAWVDPKRAASGAVRNGAVDPKRAARWIRRRVPLKWWIHAPFDDSESSISRISGFDMEISYQSSGAGVRFDTHDISSAFMVVFDAIVFSLRRLK